MFSAQKNATPVSRESWKKGDFVLAMAYPGTHTHIHIITHEREREKRERERERERERKEKVTNMLKCT